IGIREERGGDLDFAGYGQRVALPVHMRHLDHGILLRHVRRGQVERERAPLTRRALDDDLAAEQTRDLAADREAETRAAVLAARRAVGLLERLEDEALLVARNADARVLDEEADDLP